MEFAAETLAFLAAIAFLAGTIDALAGGGGLLTLPAMMAAGAVLLSSCSVPSRAARALTRWSRSRRRRCIGSMCLPGECPLKTQLLLG